MAENEKCKCPLCEQLFTPAEGMTPEKHLAIGIIKAYREMQDIPHIRELPCPRCGHLRMKYELEENTVSRHTDVYICNECGADEVLRASRNDVMPFTVWFIVCDILQCIRGIRCKDYIPEKGNPYPLCDNPNCKEAETCNKSANMND